MSTQMANKLKYNNSKGGLRDRSRDFVSKGERDPSIKFPHNSRDANNKLLHSRPAYNPSPCHTRDMNGFANILKTVVPSSSFSKNAMQDTNSERLKSSYLTNKYSNFSENQLMKSKQSSHSVGFRTMQDEGQDEKHQRPKSIPRRHIPILPRRAAPSNIRSRSNYSRNNIIPNNSIDGDKDEPSAGRAINQYEMARYRSRQTSKD